jgi:hypothetical protein
LLTGHPDDLFPHPPWARIATSDEQREQFLELADKWMSDAKSIDQGIELRPTEAAKASEMRDLRNDAHRSRAALETRTDAGRSGLYGNWRSLRNLAL